MCTPHVGAALTLHIFANESEFAEHLVRLAQIAVRHFVHATFQTIGRNLRALRAIDERMANLSLSEIRRRLHFVPLFTCERVDTAANVVIASKIAPTYAFFFAPFLPPFDMPLFLPYAMFVVRLYGRCQLKKDFNFELRENREQKTTKV
jgi:hypothetical protein